jgi:hypothetical protein
MPKESLGSLRATAPMLLKRSVGLSNVPPYRIRQWAILRLLTGERQVTEPDACDGKCVANLCAV